MIVGANDDTKAIDVLTNYHVVDGASAIQVRTSDDQSFQAQLKGSDWTRDLALLSVCCNPGAKVLTLADSQSLQAGESVFAMGYPLGVETALVTSGIVSGQFFQDQKQRWVIQTDAPINPGNSGGPLLALDGQVVGINTFVVRESAGGVPVEGTGFAVAAQTVKEQLAALSSQAPMPTPTPTPGPDVGNSLLAGPFSTAMPHRANDDAVETFSAVVRIRDFSASVRLENPVAASANSWDYGLLFRDNVATGFDAIVLASDSSWAHYRWTPEVAYTLVDDGQLTTFNVGQNQSNDLRILAIDDKGWVFVNGVLVAELDLSGNRISGDVQVLSGFYVGNATPGLSTNVRKFTVGDLGPLASSSSGTLLHDNDNLIEEAPLSVTLANLAVEVAFENPYPPTIGEWDYGLAIRDDEQKFLAFVIRSDGLWDLMLCNPGATLIDRGTATATKFNVGALNHIRLFAIGSRGWVWINDTLVTELDLSSLTAAGGVSALTGFYEGREIAGFSTNYSDLMVRGIH